MNLYSSRADRQSYTQLDAHIHAISSVRFVKKTLGGLPTGERVEAPQALTCNINTGVRIDPRSSNRRRLGGGSKKSSPPGKSDPVHPNECSAAIVAVTISKL